jgi:hypothetical protein
MTDNQIIQAAIGTFQEYSSQITKLETTWVLPDRNESTVRARNIEALIFLATRSKDDTRSMLLPKKYVNVLMDAEQATRRRWTYPVILGLGAASMIGYFVPKIVEQLTSNTEWQLVGGALAHLFTSTMQFGIFAAMTGSLSSRSQIALNKRAFVIVGSIARYRDIANGLLELYSSHDVLATRIAEVLHANRKDVMCKLLKNPAYGITKELVIYIIEHL